MPSFSFWKENIHCFLLTFQYTVMLFFVISVYLIYTYTWFNIYIHFISMIEQFLAWKTLVENVLNRHTILENLLCRG